MKVSYHKEIVTDITKVKGGGWFRRTDETNTITFYGASFDFGAAKLEDIRKCIEDGKVFTNPDLTHLIVNNTNFSFDTGFEIIELSVRSACH